MAIATSLNSQRPYVLKADREEPVEKQTTFHLRSISAKLRAQLMTQLERDQGQGLYELVRHGVAGWDNLVDKDGEQIAAKVSKGILCDTSMEAIGDFWLELGQAAIMQNQLDETDQGNSESSPKSPATG